MATVSALDVRVEETGHGPDLLHFIAALSNVSKALIDVDRAATPGRIQRPKWVVNDLRHDNNFFNVQLTAAPVKTRDRDSLLLPVSALVTGVKELREQPELPPFYSESTVSRLLQVARPRDGIQEVSLATVNGVVGHYEVLDSAVVENAESAVREAEVSIGSITGTLTGLKTTRSGLRITVHDPVARRTVNGTAALALADDLRPCWNHRVTLRGRITRNLVGQALRISATNVERMPEEKPRGQTARALFGAAPDWTGGLSVEEFMSRTRRRA
jgi:hypothetical protein